MTHFYEINIFNLCEYINRIYTIEILIILSNIIILIMLFTIVIKSQDRAGEDEVVKKI